MSAWNPHEPPQTMIPARERRRTVAERGLLRIVATAGIVRLVTVILAAVLWSSRQL